jgi:hypothetical protein
MEEQVRFYEVKITKLKISLYQTENKSMIENAQVLIQSENAETDETNLAKSAVEIGKGFLVITYGLGTFIMFFG